MIYTYYCTSKKCNKSQDENHPVAGFKEFRPTCGTCGKPCEYRFTPSIPQIAFKDGPSGSWPSKGERYKKYRANRTAQVKRKQFDRYGAPKELIPNYQGNQTENWSEARNMAIQDKDKDLSDRLASAKTYETRVKKEPKKIRA